MKTLRSDSASSTVTERIGRPLVGFVVAAIASLMLLVSVFAPSAQAATSNNGVCELGEFCYYYNSNNAGSLRDFTDATMPSYLSSGGSCYTFKSAGAGQGLCVKNEAASVWNRMTFPVTVYFNSNYIGSNQVLASGVKVNLNTTLKNNNASHQGRAVPPTPTSVAPYFSAWEDTLVGFEHYARVEFRASDLYNGRHIKSVYVRLTRLNCKFYPDADTGRVYSVSASSPSDTSFHAAFTQISDSPLPSCAIRSYWGVAEYF